MLTKRKLYVHAASVIESSDLDQVFGNGVVEDTTGADAALADDVRKEIVDMLRQRPGCSISPRRQVPTTDPHPLDLQALRRIAEAMAATIPGPYAHDGHRVPAWALTGVDGVDGGDTYLMTWMTPQGGRPTKDQAKVAHGFVNAFRPEVVLALLDLIDAPRIRTKQADAQERGDGVTAYKTIDDYTNSYAKGRISEQAVAFTMAFLNAFTKECKASVAVFHREDGGADVQIRTARSRSGEEPYVTFVDIDGLGKLIDVAIVGPGPSPGPSPRLTFHAGADTFASWTPQAVAKWVADTLDGARLSRLA